MKDKSYCGCCGRPIQGNLWCIPCAKHVLISSTGKPIHQRTYFAQHGIDCPYQLQVQEQSTQ